MVCLLDASESMPLSHRVRCLGKTVRLIFDIGILMLQHGAAAC